MSVSGSLAVGGAVPHPGQSDYILERIKAVMSSDWEDEVRRDCSARSVDRLDPDLASARSLSLSAAIRLQAARNTERKIIEGRRYWLSDFKRATGTEWVG